MGEHKRNMRTSSRLIRRSSKSAVTAVIIILCIVVIVAVDLFSRRNNSPLKVFEPARVKGQQEAPLQILEFIDFQCPECARGAALLKSYIEKYPDGIYLSIKYFPLGELNSNISAFYAECAARQDQFWKFHDLLFMRQAQWRTLLEVQPFLNIMAKDANLNITEMESCIEREDVKSVVVKEKALGESNFVKSTPTYFINDEMVVGVESMRKVLIDFFEAQKEEF
jgi:protein-disulfide isomerase